VSCHTAYASGSACGAAGGVPAGVPGSGSPDPPTQPGQPLRHGRLQPHRTQIARRPLELGQHINDHVRIPRRPAESSPGLRLHQRSIEQPNDIFAAISTDPHERIQDPLLLPSATLSGADRWDSKYSCLDCCAIRLFSMPPSVARRMRAGG
jgi:hypothetical protein